jgi:hypothetical protein
LVNGQHKRNFAEYFAQKRQRGFISLRRRSRQLRLGGNPALLIWLSKQYLGTNERAVRRQQKKNFAEYFAQKGQRGFISLRQRSWQLALGGNPALLI